MNKTVKPTTQDLKNQSNAPLPTFWEKADRIAIMTAGGAALGSAIAMVPGAVVGGILAGAYGYYIGFVKSKSL